MLTNLIAFDLKNSARLLVPLHIALLIFTILGRITLGSDFLMQMPDEIFALLVIFYVMMVIVVGVISSFYFIYWFYKNLFTDEGYLMHTLPVRPWQLVASKLTGLFFWQVIDGCHYPAVHVHPVHGGCHLCPGYPLLCQRVHHFPGNRSAGQPG